MTSTNNKSIFKEIYYQPYKRNPVKLCDFAKDNISLVKRLGLIQTLPLHQGCVNTLSWNESGSLLLSGSDDQHLVVTNGHTYEVCHNYRTSHRANIFSAKFMPVSGDHHIVSCSGDGIVLYTDLERPSETYYNQFSCHSGTSYEVITIPNDPNTFLSCGEDGTVRWFDLRIKSRCKKARCEEDILIAHQRAVTALSINPTMPHELAIGSSDSTVRTFDRRMLGTVATGYTKTPVYEPLSTFTVPELEERTYRITSLSYSPDGQEMLVSYSSDHLYLFRIRDQTERELKPSKHSKSSTSSKRVRRSPPPVRRLRLRGDWSDTGPDARPERDATSTVNIGQARPQLQATLMERMTNVLFRMLNDPLTRAALSAGGEDSLETNSSSANSQETALAEATEPSQEGSSEEVIENVTIEELNESETDGQDNSSSTTQQSPSPEISLNSTSNSTITQESSSPVATTSTPAGVSPKPAPKHNISETAELNSLQNKLTSMRHGFIERHGSEPSVSLRYSEVSSTNSTIRLGVGNEVNRSSTYGLSPETSGSNSTSQEASTSRAQNLELNSNDVLMTDIRSNKSGSEFELEYSDSEEDKDEQYEECGRVFEPYVRQKYVGHRNARTMIKEATFWGNDYVMSGSDCGHVFIWDRFTAKLIMLLQADQHVVNCLQPHPTLPILATSGIDHDVKLWSPILEDATFDGKLAEDLMKRNEVMLEETRDTITVPAAFMIRMLACLNQIRRTGSLSRSRRREEPQQPEADP